MGQTGESWKKHWFPTVRLANGDVAGAINFFTGNTMSFLAGEGRNRQYYRRWRNFPRAVGAEICKKWLSPVVPAKTVMGTRFMMLAG